jgi:glycosyltransferase involved in cell wall biosynthesis
MTELENGISVIIPTLAEGKRTDSLLRAIDSVRSQEGVKAVPVIVVNGNRFDPSLVERLGHLKGITMHMEPLGGVINARVVGRRLVETPYYSFLDDDDELLPHALRSRLDSMLVDERIDVVVSNGYRFDGSARSISAHNIADAKKDPFLALLDNNWLTSCGGLYRTARIDAAFFADSTEYAEWTYLAFKLSLSHRITFLNKPGYVINDTAGSLSKSLNYSSALAHVFERVLDLPLPPSARSAVKRKYGSALHDLSNYCLDAKEPKKALQYHLKSLCQPGGMRFLLYSRRFLNL